MLPGQYVAPGWLEGNAGNASPDPASPPTGGASWNPFGGGAPPGAPGTPAAPGQGWGMGKTALAVGAGVAAVAGVAYVASNTGVGRSLLGTSPSSSGFGAVGDLFSKLMR
jgi:hypothetical protein